MNMQGLFSKIMGFLVIIITLALAPSINTANATVAAANLTNLIGMDVVTDFGAPLIVLGLLVVGGIFVWKGTGGASMAELFKTISLVIVAIVALTFMEDIVTYTNTLIAASSGFAVTLYGIIPLLVYLGIIAAVGFTGKSAYSGGKKGKKAAAQVNY
jgi:hypothetical protein